MNRFLIATVMMVLAVSSQTQAALVSVAAFDVNLDSSAVTQSGFTAINDGDASAAATPYSAIDGAVTLTITNPHNQDRDRGVGGAIAGHPQADLLRDFAFSTNTQSMVVQLSGLNPNQEYVITAFGLDRQFNTNASAAWFSGTVAAGQSANGDNFLTTHQNRTDDASGADFNLILTSSAAGTIDFAGRGAGGVPGAGEFAFLNGLEVFERPTLTSVIDVDVNDIASPKTEVGFVPLTLSAVGSTTGSVTDNGVTVTVTTDRTDTPDRDRNNTPGEDLLDDFIFANDILDVQIDGLVEGQFYELTVFSLDTNGNNGQQSQWLLNGEILKTDHFNGTGVANLDAGSFTVYLTAPSSSITLNARNVPGRTGDLLFFNGISIATKVIPEPTTALLGLMGLAGLATRRRRAA